MIHWKERALELHNTTRLSYKDITDIIEKEYKLEKMYQRVRLYILKCKKDVKEVSVVKAKNEKKIAIPNFTPNHYEPKWDGTETIKFAIMGDTQMGSKYAQITYLHSFYDLCEKEGVKDVYHTGDLTEGLKMRVGHEYELYTVSADDMRDDVIKNYPMR